jgi:hypothetical protein
VRGARWSRGDHGGSNERVELQGGKGFPALQAPQPAPSVPRTHSSSAVRSQWLGVIRWRPFVEARAYVRERKYKSMEVRALPTLGCVCP